MSAKHTVIEMIQQIPDDVTIEDIIRRVCVWHEIDEGLDELNAGRGIAHEEMERRNAEWLD